MPGIPSIGSFLLDQRNLNMLYNPGCPYPEHTHLISQRVRYLYHSNLGTADKTFCGEIKT